MLSSRMTEAPGVPALLGPFADFLDRSLRPQSWALFITCPHGSLPLRLAPKRCNMWLPFLPPVLTNLLDRPKGPEILLPRQLRQLDGTWASVAPDSIGMIARLGPSNSRPLGIVVLGLKNGGRRYGCADRSLIETLGALVSVHAMHVQLEARRRPPHVFASDMPVREFCDAADLAVAAARDTVTALFEFPVPLSVSDRQTYRLGQALDRMERLLTSFDGSAQDGGLGSISSIHLLQTAISAVRSEADARGVQIEVEAHGRAPVLYGDKLRLLAGFVGLLAGTVRATRPAGTVVIRLSASDDPTPPEVRIAIMETTQGLARELRGLRFRELVSYDPRFSLAIPHCQQILADHGGTLEVLTSSTDGVVIVVTLPLRPTRFPE